MGRPTPGEDLILSTHLGLKHAAPLAALFVAVTLVPALAGAFATVPAAPEGPAAERLRVNLDGWIDRTVTQTDAEAMMTIPEPRSAIDIGPGSHLLISFGGSTYGCTANFIWTDGTKFYLGAAGHCFLPEDKTATHGTGWDYNASGVVTKVCISECYFGGETGFIVTGTLRTLGPVVYARQTQGGVDIGNDFGLVEIPQASENLIRTSMMVWGGPTTTETLQLGEVTCHYGNGIGVGEAYPTMARAGVGITSGANAWYMDSASAPGDSGSAVNVCAPDSLGVHGRGAVGILTHLVVNTGFVAGTTVSRAISMATQAGLSISLELE